jgi:hypothetical protein
MDALQKPAADSLTITALRAWRLLEPVGGGATPSFASKLPAASSATEKARRSTALSSPGPNHSSSGR